MTSNSDSDSSTLTPAEARWETLGLTPEALQIIEKAGFTRPTPVQAASLPITLAGKDLIASAQTGTGKTLSFALPMIERFVGRQGTYGLVLAPTREIAQQIQATIELLGAPRGVRSIVLIGGISMHLDAQALGTYPQIIVATPGRLCDHLDRGNIWLDFIEIVVLDEADRMLAMGFADQLSRIMEDVPKNRQTMLFSATIPPSVEKLAHRILHKPEQVRIGKPLSAATTVEQNLIWTTEENKKGDLMRLLRQEKGSIIVFTRSKDNATRVWRSLHSAGVYDATYIHSDRLQSHREQALAEFKEGKYRILVATDVAGRGIHVDGVAHVVNYDLPLDPEDYIHRIGRTGRAEATGKATTFATSRDRSLLNQIERIMGYPIPGADRGAPPKSGGHGGRSGGRSGHSAPGADRGSEGGGQARSAEGGAGDAPGEGRSGRRRRRPRGRRGGAGRGTGGSGGKPTEPKPQ